MVERIKLRQLIRTAERNVSLRVENGKLIFRLLPKASVKDLSVG